MTLRATFYICNLTQLVAITAGLRIVFIKGMTSM